MWMRRLILALLVLSMSAAVAWAQDGTPSEANTYTSEDGRLSLTYPAGWVSRTSGTNTYLGNSEAALDYSYGEAFAAGEIQVSVYTGAFEEMASQSGVSADASVLEVLEGAIAGAPEGDNTRFEALESFAFKGNDAAGVRFAANTFEGYALFVAFGDGNYVAVQALTAADEFALWQAKVSGLIASIEYNAAGSSDATLELSETYSAPEDGIASINYPAGWATRESFPPGVDIASSEAALDLWLFDGFEAGDVHISISYGSAADVFDEVPEGDVGALELLNYILGIEAESDERLTIETPEALSVDDRRAAETRGVADGSTSYVVVIEYGDGMFVAAQVQSTTDENERWEALLLEMLETLEVAETD